MKNAICKKNGEGKRGKSMRYPLRYTVRLPDEVALKLHMLPRLEKRGIARLVRVKVVQAINDNEKNHGGNSILKIRITK